MNCKQCNLEIRDDDARCPVCGSSQARHIPWYDFDGRRILRFLEPYLQELEVIREYAVALHAPPAKPHTDVLNLGAALVLDVFAGTDIYGSTIGAGVEWDNAILVLTNRRLLVGHGRGWAEWGARREVFDIRELWLAHITGATYRRGRRGGTLTIFHDGGQSRFIFWAGRWRRHADNMSALISRIRGPRPANPGSSLPR